MRFKNFSIRFSLTALLLAAFLPAKSADFFSTDDPEQFMTFGARIGVNTSNTSVTHKAIHGYNVNSWGTGFDIGAVCDIHFKDFISLQPGFFFESRSNDYTYNHTGMFDETPMNLVQMGHMRNYRFVIPVVGSLHLNVSDDVRCSVDLGPYLAISLGSDRNDKSIVISDHSALALQPFSQKPKGAEFGFKVGAGIQVLGNYYFGIHYYGAFTGAWKDYTVDNIKTTYGGHNKAWTFTIGYDF